MFGINIINSKIEKKYQKHSRTLMNQLKGILTQSRKQEALLQLHKVVLRKHFYVLKRVGVLNMNKLNSASIFQIALQKVTLKIKNFSFKRIYSFYIQAKRILFKRKLLKMCKAF